MGAGPRVSVVIPVYNSQTYLAEAIASVLAQWENDLEILVVDDGSTDDSAGVAAGFGDPVRVIRQSNRGPAAARNRGIEAARAGILAFLDADDQFTPEKLALQLDRLARHPHVQFVMGQIQYGLAPDDAAQGPRIAAVDQPLVLSLGCGLFRRSVFDQIGLLDESMRLCEDWDWFLRAREAAVPMLLHRHVVLRQRLHAGNLSRQREAGARSTLEMFRRSLARRRAGAALPTSLPPLATFLEPEEAVG